jgi:hypothetical protein
VPKSRIRSRIRIVLQLQLLFDLNDSAPLGSEFGFVSVYHSWFGFCLQNNRTRSCTLFSNSKFMHVTIPFYLNLINLRCRKVLEKRQKICFCRKFSGNFLPWCKMLFQLGKFLKIPTDINGIWYERTGITSIM